MPENSFEAESDELANSLFIPIEETIKEIKTYYYDPDSPRYLIIFGGRGTGKTSIANYIYFKAKYAHIIYHCRDSVTPKKFIESMAQQLSEAYDSYLSFLNEQIEYFNNNSEINFKINLVYEEISSKAIIKSLDFEGIDPKKAFDAIIRQPLEKMNSKQELNNLIILIDDFELTAMKDDFGTIISIFDLIKTAGDFPDKVRFILMCRPNNEIADYFKNKAKFINLDEIFSINDPEILNSFIKNIFHIKLKKTDFDINNIVDIIINSGENNPRILRKIINFINSDKFDPNIIFDPNTIKLHPTKLKDLALSFSNDDKKHSNKKEFNILPQPLSDYWSEIDSLGFFVYAEAIVDFIMNEKTRKPLVIGIDAPWGMGKTTLMHMIEKELIKRAKVANPITIQGFDCPWGLDQETLMQIFEEQIGIKIMEEKIKNSYPTVWFNAWKYDKEDSLWAALALETLDQIKDKFGYLDRIFFWLKLTKKRLSIVNAFISIFGKIIFPICLIIISLFFTLYTIKTPLNENYLYTEILPLIGLVDYDAQLIVNIMIILGALIVAIGLVVKIIKDPFQLPLNKMLDKPNYKERIGSIQHFNKDFSSIVSVATSIYNSNNKKLVILIDDLDRCAPPRPVEIIEAINTLLDSDNCIFIIGMDTRMVGLSIESRYKELNNYISDYQKDSGHTLGQLFLEKIIHINFKIPKVSNEAAQAFINLALNGIEKKANDISLEQIDEAKELIQRKIKDSNKKSISLIEAEEAVKALRPDLSGDVLKKAKEDLFPEYLFEESNEIRDAIQQVPKYIGYNPRKIKKFINIFRLQALIANRRGLLENGVIKLDILAKYIAITMRWPNAYDAINDKKNIFNMLMEARNLKLHDESTLNENEKNMLNTYMEDPFIKSMINSTELLELIGYIYTKCNSLEEYVHLSQISIGSEK